MTNAGQMGTMDTESWSTDVTRTLCLIRGDGLDTKAGISTQAKSHCRGPRVGRASRITEPRLLCSDAEVWNDIFDLNAGLPYRVIRELNPLLADGASICHVSSIAATMPWVVSPAYGAAKAALEHWSRSLAVQLAPRGVRVNLVRPGFVWSRQWAAVTRAEFDEVVADRVPLQQFGDAAVMSKEQHPSDVARAVAYLASGGARHLTGQALDIDGGASLVRAAR